MRSKHKKRERATAGLSYAHGRRVDDRPCGVRHGPDGAGHSFFTRTRNAVARRNKPGAIDHAPAPSIATAFSIVPDAAAVACAVEHRDAIADPLAGRNGAKRRLECNTGAVLTSAGGGRRARSGAVVRFIACRCRFAA